MGGVVGVNEAVVVDDVDANVVVAPDKVATVILVQPAHDKLHVEGGVVREADEAAVAVACHEGRHGELAGAHLERKRRAGEGK